MRFASVLVAACVLGGSAMADPALGTWLTEPDKKGQVAHVRVYECAKALCGQIVRTFNAAGQEIAHPNTGKRVFWNMIPEGGGEYEGRAFVPAHNREYAAEMQLAGNRLTVRGCLGPVCMSQLWKRVN